MLFFFKLKSLFYSNTRRSFATLPVCLVARREKIPGIFGVFFFDVVDEETSSECSSPPRRSEVATSQGRIYKKQNNSGTLQESRRRKKNLIFFCWVFSPAGGNREGISLVWCGMSKSRKINKINLKTSLKLGQIAGFPFLEMGKNFPGKIFPHLENKHREFSSHCGSQNLPQNSHLGAKKLGFF